MRVVIISGKGNLSSRISRLLANYDIKGDVTDKFTRHMMNQYDAVIFTYQNNVPNIPKVLERIVLERNIQVVYITNTPSIGQFYNLFDDPYFNYIQEHKIDLVLTTILRHTNKYLKQISILENKNTDLKDELLLIKNTNKAKRILMNKGLSEDESHRFIIDKAMENRTSKKRIVNLIIKNKIDI